MATCTSDTTSSQLSVLKPLGKGSEVFSLFPGVCMLVPAKGSMSMTSTLPNLA